MYTVNDQYAIERAIIFASHHLSAKQQQKPVLLHSMRVGMSLMKQGYAVELVIAGFLHDIIEDTDQDHAAILMHFGKEVADLVSLNTKNPKIKDKIEQRRELIERCVKSSKNAAIIKAADIIDNYSFYTAQDNPKGIEYCRTNAADVLQYIHPDWADPIFDELMLQFANRR